MTLEALLHQLSLEVWDFLDTASAKAGFIPREETLTEMLLVQMAGSSSARVLKQTVASEGRTGADFGLAVQLPTGSWLSLIVQAKKLNPRSATFEELAKESARPQVAALLAEGSLSSSAPVYLLYSGSALAARGSSIRPGRCSRGNLTRERTGYPHNHGETPAGALLVPAQHVANLLPRALAQKPRELLPAALPWECLVCPVSGERVVRAIGSAGQDDTGSAWLTQDAPAWAVQVLQTPRLATIDPPRSAEEQPPVAGAPFAQYLAVLPSE